MKSIRAPEMTARMLDHRQRDYLAAMDIGVWSLREAVAPETDAVESQAQLKLGPGSGGTLLVCAIDTDSASRLANDISRVLGSSPVWAWQYSDSDAVNLTQAVDENLFTTVAIFGEALAGQFFGGETPSHLNSAKLVLLPSMQDIQNRAEARRELWDIFCRSGMLEQG